MSLISPNRLGYLIVFIIQISFFAIILIFCLEFFGISKTFLPSSQDRAYNKLPELGYYSDPKITSDPYSPFTIQHLHPYYMFSLPWRESDRKIRSNRIVGIDKSGFRINPANRGSSIKSIVLVGGSTAFGHFSSSDENTIAANLSKDLTVNVVNRNAPSWNTHQELIALAKYAEPYDLSMSFTLINDISVACERNFLWDTAYAYTDSPESFTTLSERVDNIRNDAVNIPFLRSFKAAVRNLIPDTYNLLGSSLKSETVNSECITPVEKIVSAFLKNQSAMNALSIGRGASHLVVLQPHVDLLDKEHPRYSYKRKVYDAVMNSEFCSINECIDLSYSLNQSSTVYLFDGTNLDMALFADRVHLLDRGVKFYTSYMSAEIKKIDLIN